MAETKIPNSEDLFEIYKSQLELVNNINKIIVKNKMDKKFFNTLKKCIERSTDALETILYGLERISSIYSVVNIRAKNLKDFNDNIYEYQSLMETISGIPLKVLTGNRIRIMLLKMSMKSMFKFIEKLGNYNPISILKAKISLKAMEPIMESLEMVTAPLKKISLIDIIRYKTTVIKYRMLIRKMLKLMDYIGSWGVLTFAKAKANIKMATDSIGMIPNILQILEKKISIWQLLRARNSLKKVSILLFGNRRDIRRAERGRRGALLFPKTVFGLIQKMSIIDPTISIRSRINMLMIKSIFKDLNETLTYIQENLGWIEKSKIQTNIERMWSLMFGDERSWPFKWLGKKKKGVMHLVVDMLRALSSVDAIKSAITAMSLVVFIKAINVVLRSLSLFTGLFGKKRFKTAQLAISRMYEVLFGAGKMKRKGWKDKGPKSVITLVRAFADNEKTFEDGFTCMINIAQTIVNLFTTLSQLKVKQAGQSLIALKIMRLNFKNLLKIAILITGKKKGKDKPEQVKAAIDTLKIMIEFVAETNTIINNTPSPKDAVDASKSISLIEVVIGVLMKVSTSIGTKEFLEQAKSMVESTKVIGEFVSVASDFTKNAIDSKKSLDFLAAMILCKMSIKKIIKISKLIGTDEFQEKMSVTINSMHMISLLSEEMREAVDNAPDAFSAINLNMVLESMIIAVLEFSLMMWLIKKTKIGEQDATGATAAFNNMEAIMEIYKKTTDNTPKFEDSTRLNHVLESAIVAIIEFGIMVWLINVTKIGQQDSSGAIAAFNNMATIMETYRKATDVAPDLFSAINLNAILVLSTVAIFEFGFMVWLINITKLGEQNGAGAISVFNNMAAVMEALGRAANSTPDIPIMIKMMIVMPLSVIALLEYWLVLKIVDSIASSQDTGKTQTFFKDMSATLKDFCNVINDMPEPKDAIKAAATMPIIMVIIGGYILVMSLISTRLTQSRKSHRVITSMIGAIGGVVLIILAMIAAGAMIVLGMVLIGITFTFIATMIGMMALLSMAGKFLKKGAIALLLIDAAILGMVATLALMALLAETIDLRQIALTMLIMLTTLGAMALMIYGLAKFEAQIMKGMIPMTLIIVMTGMAAYAMSMIGDVAKETEAGDLLGTSQIMTLVMAELGAMAFALSKIPKQDLIAGELALAGITLILNAAMPAFRSLGEVAAMTEAGDLLGTSQIMVLVIGELGLMAATAGFLLMGPQAAAFALGEVAMWTISKVATSAAGAMKVLAEASMAMDAAGITGDPTEVARKLSEKLLIPLRALQLAPEATHDRKGFFGNKKGYEAGSVLDYLSQLGLVEMGKSALKIASISKTVLKIKDICTAAMQVTAMPPINPDKLTAPIFAIVGRDGEGGIVFALNKVKRRKLRQTKRKVQTISKILRILNKIAKRAVKLSRWKIPDSFGDQMDVLGTVIEKTVTVMDEKLKTDVVDRLLSNTKNYLMSTILMGKATDQMIKTQAKAKDITIHTINNGTEDTLTISWMASRILKDISEAGSVSKDQVLSLGLLMNLPYDKFLETCGKYENIKFVKIEDRSNTPAGHAVELIARSVFQNVDGSNLNQRTSAWKQATDDSVKLIKSVNTLDISRVTSLRDLMHELYLFSDSIQGDFDKLADVINEKLLEALGKLTDALDGVNNKDFSGLGGESGSGESVAKPTDGSKANTQPKKDQTKEKLEKLQSDMTKLTTILNTLNKCIGSYNGSTVMFTHEQ